MEDGTGVKGKGACIMRRTIYGERFRDFKRKREERRGIVLVIDDRML